MMLKNVSGVGLFRCIIIQL